MVMHVAKTFASVNDTDALSDVSIASVLGSVCQYFAT